MTGTSFCSYLNENLSKTMSNELVELKYNCLIEAIDMLKNVRIQVDYLPAESFQRGEKQLNGLYIVSFVFLLVTDISVLF